MSEDGFLLRDFTQAHIPGALALSRQEHWPHRAEDWAMQLSLSSGIVALDGERVVGTALLTPFGSAGTSLNMIIVDAALRGLGLGRRLIGDRLSAAGARECRLVATEAGRPLYEKLGFRAAGTILQHQGHVLPAAMPAGVDWCGAERLPACAAMDRDATGFDRGSLLTLLFAQAQIAMCERDGKVTGFLALRPFGRGAVVGPVVAETAEDARALLTFAFAARPGAFLRVDTPEELGLSPWLTEQGLSPVDSGLAMRRNAAPVRPVHFHSFALASQALG